MSELTTTLSEAFDTANEHGTPTFEPLPKGSYVASITDAKVGALIPVRDRPSISPGRLKAASTRDG